MFEIAYSQPATWVKIIGDSIRNMSGVSGVQTFDGGYVVLAYKQNAAYQDALLLLKLNYLGNLVWQKFPADTISNMNPIKLVQTKDSGLVMLGYDGNLHINFLLKTDKNGNFQWRKNYPDTVLSEPRLYGFIKTLDNGFILCGNFTSYNPTLEKGYLIKTDSLGNVKWQRGYYDSISNNYANLIQFPDSNYYVCGSTYNTANNVYSLVKKLSISGNEIWTKIFLLYTGAGFIIKLIDNNIGIVSTQFNWGYYLTIIDTSNNIINTKFLNIPDQVSALNLFYNGNIIVSGSVVQGSTIGINEISLFDSSIFIKIFSHQGYNNIGANCTQNTSDNGFIMIGNAAIINKYYILIIKIDSSFNAPLILSLSKDIETFSNNFELFQNYPNPFNPSTNIRFNIPENENINIKIYDITGREIFRLLNHYAIKGLNQFSFDANKYNLCSGLYLLAIEFKGKIKSNKLVFIK